MYVCALNSWKKKSEDVSIWSDKLLNVKCIKLVLNSQNYGKNVTCHKNSELHSRLFLMVVSICFAWFLNNWGIQSVNWFICMAAQKLDWNMHTNCERNLRLYNRWFCLLVIESVYLCKVVCCWSSNLLYINKNIPVACRFNIVHNWRHQLYMYMLNAETRMLMISDFLCIRDVMPGWFLILISAVGTVVLRLFHWHILVWLPHTSVRVNKLIQNW